ncbi:MAG: tRNA(Ile)-lysidine synthetase-like protein [Cellvibrionaceae bacterium]|jgi:tRNA(Ile)-lysidine synthetase-like protein
MSKFDQVLANFFKANPTLQEHGPLVVAVSGGRDSLCLLHWLAHSPVITERLIVVTIDHRLRPESAAECEQVRQMAISWGSECQIKQTPLTADTFTENNGRMARYTLLKDVAVKVGASHIFTGHHAGDQAESVLLHLLRGSGLNGLTGMREQTYLAGNDEQVINLVRPMLSTSPDMLDAYAAEHGLNLLEDPSNNDEKYTRNRIRHTLVPLLEEEFNPQIQKSLSQMAGILQDDWAALEEVHDRYWEQTAEESGIGWGSLDFDAWHTGNTSFQRYALRRLYAHVHGSSLDITQENLETARLGLSQQRTDKRYQLSGSVWVQKTYDILLVYHNSAAALFDAPQIIDSKTELGIRIDQPSTVKLSNGQWQLHVFPILPDEIVLQEAAENRWVAFLSIKEGSELVLRGRRQGESFRPFRFNGDVQLKNLMIDRKIPVLLRDQWPLIADEKGLLWVAGHRLAARAAVTVETSLAVKIVLEKTDNTEVKSYE